MFCDVGSSPQIIRGYVSHASNSRPDIETIQNSLRIKGSSVRVFRPLTVFAWMGENRMKAIIVLKTPTTIKELRSALGTINFVRKFILNLAIIIEPLVALTRKSVANLKTLRNHWGPEQDAAFIKVKELLISAPVLHFPQFHKPFIIHVDASDCGVGAFLAQNEGNEELAIIANFSKRFTSTQQHYSATQKECLAVVLVVAH